MRADIEAGRYHGAAMQVSRRGEVIVDFVGGYADKAAGLPLKRDSVFITMSVVKSFVNVLTLSLVERGLLRLHAPIVEVLPEFAPFGKDTVTLFNLLTHTAGLMSGRPPVGPEIWANIENLTAYLSARPLECSPGTRVSYSMSVAHSLIAALCLRVDGRGRNFATMLAEDLLQPLGMNNTNLGWREDLAARVCPIRMGEQVPYDIVPPGSYEAVEKVILTPGTEMPAGGGLTTIDDLHRFAEMLRRGGELDGIRILSPFMLKFAAQVFTGDQHNAVWDAIAPSRHWSKFPANIGIGFYVRGHGVHPSRFGVMNSPGAFGGFGAGSTGVWVDPEHELSFSFLSTGLLEESHSMERTGTLSDLVMSAVTD
ncbi:MAG: serine hydrolase [Devosia sp.]|nr:serine hydrolase [Devosia sp.]